MRDINLHYTTVHPAGRCVHCKGAAILVTQGSHAGKYVWRATRDRIGNEGWEHISCGEREGRTLTADFDHYAESTGTSRKPGQS